MYTSDATIRSISPQSSTTFARTQVMLGSHRQSDREPNISQFDNQSKGRALGSAALCTAVMLMLSGVVYKVSAQTALGSVEPPSASPGGGATLHHPYPRYAIKRQDVLQISFPLTPELNQTLTVQPDGYINPSGAESVHVEGMTVPEAENSLKDDYASTLNKPIIHLDLKDFQKPFFTVNGQVGKPGQYELRSDITVAEAIAIAGGLSPTANGKIYLFRRTAAERYNVSKLDVKKIMKGTNHSDNAVIREGDMIVVPESGIATFKKYVPYSIGGYVNPTSY